MPAFIAFDGPCLLAEGSRLDCALALRRAREKGAAGPLLAFDFETGAGVDFDPRGTEDEISERLGETEEHGPRGRGRPKLGVVAREVTLLPRHWDWLAAQPGGASVALRKLVDEARRRDQGATDARNAKAAVYRFLSAMAGDLPGFEEAARDLFADRLADFEVKIADWPRDIAALALRRLAEAAAAAPSQS